MIKLVHASYTVNLNMLTNMTLIYMYVHGPEMNNYYMYVHW